MKPLEPAGQEIVASEVLALVRPFHFGETDAAQKGKPGLPAIPRISRAPPDFPVAPVCNTPAAIIKGFTPPAPARKPIQRRRSGLIP